MDNSGGRVAGVDGCPNGWVAAVWSDAGVEWRASPLSFAALLDGLADCAVVAVDVPIGMPEREPRPYDLLARAALGPPRSLVFPTPPRVVLAAADYAATALPPKRSAPGIGARLAVLAKHFGDVAARRVLRDEADRLGEPPMAIVA